MKLSGFPYSNPARVMKPKTTLSPKARYGRGDDSLGMAADAPATSKHKISRKVRIRGTMTDSALVGPQRSSLEVCGAAGRRQTTGAAALYCVAGCGASRCTRPVDG